MEFLKKHQIFVPLEFTVLDEIEITECLKVSSSTLKRHIAMGYVPKPMKLGKVPFWSTIEINALLQNITEQKRSKTTKK